MTSIAMKTKIGIAACAVAGSMSLIPITTAAAAPAPLPASPVWIAPAPATPFIKGGVTDLLWFLNNNKPDAPSLHGSGWYPGKYIKLFVIKILSLLHCYKGVS